MTMLAKHPKTVFVGQAVRFDGQRANASFSGVPQGKRIEMPVCEDFQMGFCSGLALDGFIPISFYPRWDFLILAANQLVNHLDKMPLMGAFKPKVIIRTAVGAKFPLDPGHQHTQDHSRAFQRMLDTVKVIELRTAEQIFPTYQWALESKDSCVLVEYMKDY